MEVSGFPHQVGGHFGLLSIPGHVCKPLNQREYDFYTQLDERLQPFTAKLCSRIKVQCSAPNNQPDEEGGTLVMSTETLVDCHRQTPPPTGEPLSMGMGSPANSSTATLSSFASTNSTLSMASSGGSANGRHQLVRHPSMTFRIKCGRVEAEKSVGNQWAGQCQSKVVQKLLKGHDRSFILLEDLVANYARPCVIDLKMGTRQYGDDASAQKRLTQTQKCRHSTSSTFGVRLVGMQLYDGESEEYQFVNKYEGRRMDRAQFHDALLQFFRLAGVQRTQRLIQELHRLRRVLVQAEGFRFFSSSLLIAYDGDAAMPNSFKSPNVSNEKSSEITVKMIDFAHSTFHGFLEDAPYQGIDEGYLLGIDSLIQFLTAFLQTGFKPMDDQPQQEVPQPRRLPLKRKLENANAAVTFVLNSEDGGDADEEESSINSSVGFTSDSGTEMGEPEEDGGSTATTAAGTPQLLLLEDNDDSMN